jgi:hypothetical protein
VHQVTALYADCFLPLDTRVLADVLSAMYAKAVREGDDKYMPLLERALAEVNELAGADLTQIAAARSVTAEACSLPWVPSEPQRPRG